MGIIASWSFEMVMIIILATIASVLTIFTMRGYSLEQKISIGIICALWAFISYSVGVIAV